MFQNLKKLRPRSGYDVVAVVAMFAALGTGGAYAANTIGSADVIDDSLTRADIMDGTLTGVDVRWNSLGSAAITDGSVSTNDVGDGTLTGADVNESTLAKVPSAATADTATMADKATTANSAPVKGYETFQKIVKYTPYYGDEARGSAEATVNCPAGKKVLAGSYHSIWHGHEGDNIDLATMWLVDQGSSMLVWDGAGYRVKAEDNVINRLVIRVACGYVL